ncbi:MAG: outer membrane beta-barrel protein [bacterium]|nr:outer membrane beta-barrel protein [bacterium]
MKRFVISATLIVLLAASAGSAASLKSMMMVGPYAGYTLGLSGFDDYEDEFIKTSYGPGINFGGNFHYGLNEKMMIGGEIYFQSFKAEAESKDPNFSQVNYSESESGTSFLFSALYAMSYMQRAMLLLNAGAGLYDGGSDSDIGFFGGVMYQRMLKSTMSLYLMARMHFVMASETFMMLQLAVGLHFWLGNTGAPMEM